MNSNCNKALRAVSALLLAAFAGGALAQTGQRPLTREEIAAMVAANLPEPIAKGNAELVGNLLGVKPGTPISRSFDVFKAAGRIFGRLPRTFAPDCQRTGTPAGEPDQGNCQVTNGQADGPGAFTMLSFSKNLAVGNIKFLKRPAAQDLDPTKLVPVRLANGDAEKAARTFLTDFFGLPGSELQPLPAGIAPPVRNLTIGFDKPSGVPPVVIQKTVLLKRSFELPAPIPGPGGRMLTHVPGPGMARVAMDDTGVVGASVMDWQELTPDPKMSSRNAKTPSQLVEEIADDLFEEGGGPIAEMRFQIAIGSDWRGSHGFLLPAVRVFVAPVGRGLNEDQQQLLRGGTTAGFVREYSLVNRAEADFEQR